MPHVLGLTRIQLGFFSLTVVSVSGPAEVPEPSIAQVEGGLIALPQGCAVPQGQGSMLGTPEGDDAVLLTSGRRG